MEKQIKQVSKFMSLVLRHQPAMIGLQLDENGWAIVKELIAGMNAKGTIVDFEMVNHVVESNDKRRFSFNEDKTMIRANQGHSIEVDLNLKPAVPPGTLYHGTAAVFLTSILKEGLKKQQRQHVHLSWQSATAKAVGSRHGKPVILNINSGEMIKDGHVFYLSDNNVWLTDCVPVRYITITG